MKAPLVIPSRLVEYPCGCSSRKVGPIVIKNRYCDEHATAVVNGVLAPPKTVGPARIEMEKARG